VDNGIVDEDKNVYFLHIAGTGGRALKEYVLNPLFNKNYDVVGHHNGWSNLIDDKTYIICIIRDPVKHACGFFMHFIYDHLGKVASKRFVDYRDKEQLKNDFMEYMRSHPELNNFQSKNIVVAGQTFHYGKGKYFNDIDIRIDQDLLESRISRINLLFTQDHMLDNMGSIGIKLAKDLGLDPIEVKKVDKLKYSNFFSLLLYRSLTDQDKKEIQDLNSIDYNIYSQLRFKEGGQ
jgi:hypothetical protein